jgi:phosphoribosylformylglycinamidine synthase subunit PurL
MGIGFRAEGHHVYLIGGLGETDEVRMGGTQYAKQVLKQMWGLPPKLDMEFEKRVQQAVREIVRAGAAQSAHDVSDGGLLWALAECSFVNGVGVAAELDSDLRPELLLFHEGPSRVVVATTDPAVVETVAARHGVPALRLGQTLHNRLVMEVRGTVLIDVEVTQLRERWSTALASQLEAELHV